MNHYALIIGIIVSVYIVIRFHNTKLEKGKWKYPAFLATFPVYYWVFAAYASDYDALIYELVVGFGFLTVAFVAYKLNSAIGVLLLAVGYISHAVYDVIHNSLFLNAGTPHWWPEFCGVVDVLIGIYLGYLFFSIRERKVNIA